MTVFQRFFVTSQLLHHRIDKLPGKRAGRGKRLAHCRGVSADTLVNMWVQEKLREQKA